MADKEEDTAWVFDSLVCFLNGPVWNAPLQSFIEEKSLVFEPSVHDNEQYRKIFEEFKNLVDFMLGNFMEDIGITPDQFQEACSEGRKYNVPFDHSLFEQIWAANDFDMFVRLMTQRNVELQLQALELIQHKYGIKPQSFVPKKETDIDNEIVAAVNESSSKHSLLSNETLLLENRNSEIEVLNEVAKNFVEDSKSSPRIIENVILEEKPILEEQLKHVKELKESSVTVSSTKDQEEIKKPIKISQEKHKEVDALELKKRQEYLRSQRDKLVALKKEARKKQLDVENGLKEKIKNRPKSAKAAEAVMTGENPENIEPGVLQIRRTLVERLKSEVVTKDHDKYLV